ncbi:hypothetical protein GCM10027293_14350 [Pontibacter aydingkolensis]
MPMQDLIKIKDKALKPLVAVTLKNSKQAKRIKNSKYNSGTEMAGREIRITACHFYFPPGWLIFLKEYFGAGILFNKFGRNNKCLV